MPQYNFFGCEYTDIVNAFKGAVVNDFGGQAIIEAEMELAEAELTSQMSQKALKMLSTVEYQEVPQISGSNYTLNPPLLQDLFIYRVSRYNPGLNNTVAPINGLCEDGQCYNPNKELGVNDLFTDYTVSGSTITFGPSFDQDRNTYYVSYTVDTSTLDLPSLKVIIRDRVACVLGMQLYSRSEDTWGLVELYCKRSDKWMATIDDYWLPSEFKKNKYLNNPYTIRGGLYTIRVGRG